MRTRAYHFAGFVLHKGRASNQGHYLATCWRKIDRYTEYNDDVIKDVTWQDVATKQVQGEAYVLAYVRIPGHDLHEKGLQRQKGVGPLVSSQEEKTLLVPVINR